MYLCILSTLLATSKLLLGRGNRPLTPIVQQHLEVVSLMASGTFRQLSFGREEQLIFPRIEQWKAKQLLLPLLLCSFAGSF